MIRIGIFFGGKSREREISFSGAKTAYLSLDKSIFEPVPIFTDSLGNFIRLEEEFLFNHESIRDFYPPADLFPERLKGQRPYVEALADEDPELLREMMNRIGFPIRPEDFRKYFDFAFILMHGPYGEDGTFQGMLEWMQIPYSGSGVMASAIGINKLVQKNLIDFIDPKRAAFVGFDKEEWLKGDQQEIFEDVKSQLGASMVVKAPYQGSSIGVNILRDTDFDTFADAVYKAFFMRRITKESWLKLHNNQKTELFNDLADFDKGGLGLPMIFAENSVLGGSVGDFIFRNPSEMTAKLDDYFSYSDTDALLASADSEESVLCEALIGGKEFSCGVIRDDYGDPLVLPPTEIVTTGDAGYDFEAKYVPGASRKVLPIDLPEEHIREIQAACKLVFESFDYGVCVRIDGFYCDTNKEVVIIDVNTIPGMSPTSLIFRQVAETGLDAKAFMTYLIRESLNERVKAGKRPYHIRRLLQELDVRLESCLKKEKEQPYAALLLPLKNEAGDALAEARRLYNTFSNAEDLFPHVFALKEEGTSVEILKIPYAFLLRASLEELEEGLKQPLHPIVKECMRDGESLRRRYLTEFSSEITSYSVEEITKDYKAVYLIGKGSEALLTKLRTALKEQGKTLKVSGS